MRGNITQGESEKLDTQGKEHKSSVNVLCSYTANLCQPVLPIG